MAFEFGKQEIMEGGKTVKKGDVGEHSSFQTQETLSQCVTYGRERYHAEGASA